GIAHDFNNLLTGMIAQMSLAKMKLSRDRSPVEQIDKALTAAERAADLTRQLLTYAGKAPVQVTMLDLNGLIRDNLGLLETALPNGAELHLALAETLPMIEADRGHIQQIIMNLALNAAEALRQSTLHPEPSAATAPIEKRYVSIATAVSVLSAGAKEQRSRGNHLQPGNYVVLRVQDNGIGMDESTLQRIFDPFFSTKEHGHGLGLSATLGIVHSYGGALHVKSTWGSGTTFTLFFPPIAQAAVHRADEGGASTTAAYTELSTVLVIDDESSIREVVVDVLEPLGFTVYQAVSGAEGIAQVEQHQGVVDLVLLDIKMPGLSGSETLRQLLNVQPSLKVVISSGFSKSELCAKLHDATVVGYLPKPYTAAQLLNSVYQALAG
ncbi:MAG: response regulator, partial [Caldilineaceae bacterium]|nr:response regulator [Caldilineaceae bacterium]